MYWIYTIQCIYIYIRRRAIFTYELHRCILYLSLCIWYEYMFACTRKLWICLAGWWFQHTYEDKLVIGLHIRTSQALSSWILDICAPLCPPLKSVFKSVPPRRKKKPSRYLELIRLQSTKRLIGSARGCNESPHAQLLPPKMLVAQLPTSWYFNLPKLYLSCLNRHFRRWQFL